MKQNKSIWTSIVGIITSIFAFLGIVSCCGMPVVAGLLSLLGIGASQLSFFEEYKWWFTAISIVCLVWVLSSYTAKRNHAAAHAVRITKTVVKNLQSKL